MMKQKKAKSQNTLPQSKFLDGLDDDELPLHPEMITPEEQEYKNALERVVEFNTH